MNRPYILRTHLRLIAGAVLAIATTAPVAAADADGLMIEEFKGRDGIVQTYGDDQTRTGTRGIGELNVPMAVLDTARDGQLLKIGENEWVQKNNVRLNKTAGVATDTGCLIEARRGRAAEESDSGRALSSAICE